MSLARMLILALSPALAPAAWAGEFRPIAAPGFVEPWSEERDVAAEVRGRLVKVPVDEGDQVKAGQIVAELYNADLKAQLAATLATVRRRAAELQKLENGARPEERREAAAAAEEARAATRIARITFNRRAPLAAKGWASQETLDMARENLASALAHLSTVMARQALIDAPPRAEDVAIARAALAEAQAAHDQIEAEVDKTLIRSPIDGTILHRVKREGEAVSDQLMTTIVKVGDLSRLKVRADVDETDVAHIAQGQSVAVTADAYPGKRFHGIVERLGSKLGKKNFRTDTPVEKADTKILETLIDLDPGVKLPVGLRVDVRFEEAEGRIADASGR